jgi:hypothetical protein
MNPVPSNSQSQRHPTESSCGTRRFGPQRHLPVDYPVGDARYFATFIDDVVRMTYLYPLKQKTAKEVREAFLTFGTYSSKTGDASNRFERANKWQNCAGSWASSTSLKHRPTHPSRTASRRERAGLSAHEFDRSWQKRASPRNFGRNSRVPSHISRTAAQLDLSRTKLRTKLSTGSNRISRTSSRSVRKPTSLSPRRRPRRWISAQKATESGYGGSNQYRIWDPLDNKILVSANVRFVGERKEAKENDMGTSGGGERIIYDEIVVMPEPKEFPSVHKMDEEDEEDPCTEEIDQEDDSATVTTFAEQRQRARILRIGALIAQTTPSTKGGNSTSRTTRSTRTQSASKV